MFRYKKVFLDFMPCVRIRKIASVLKIYFLNHYCNYKKEKKTVLFETFSRLVCLL